MKNFIFFFLLALFSISCTDENADSNPTNTFSAQIGGEPWESTNTYTQKERGENGPLMIVGEGDGYTLELTLGGISETGEYTMGTSINGRVEFSNTTYSTLDVENAGKIVITHFDDNNVKGTFEFDAQWLSSSNRLEVRNGQFNVFYF